MGEHGKTESLEPSKMSDIDDLMAEERLLLAEYNANPSGECSKKLRALAEKIDTILINRLMGKKEK